MILGILSIIAEKSLSAFPTVTRISECPRNAVEIWGKGHGHFKECKYKL